MGRGVTEDRLRSVATSAPGVARSKLPETLKPALQDLRLSCECLFFVASGGCVKMCVCRSM